MKTIRHSSLVILICVFASLRLCVDATPTLFSLQSLTGQISNRGILVTPDTYQNPLWLTTNLVTVAPFELQPVNGFVITNLTPWGYTIKVDQWPRSLHIYVTNDTALHPVTDFINPNNYSPLNIYLTGTNQFDPFGTAAAVPRGPTISAIGIANGTATTTNNGSPFGIDTPGTTTCGIQEWANSLTYATNKFAPGGGAARLSSGIFNITSPIILTNNNTAGWSLLGAGLSSTIILYNGQSISNIVVMDSSPTNDANLALTIEDLAIMSATNMQANCIQLNHSSTAIIQRVVFGSWFAATNNGMGTLGLQPGLSQAGYLPPGLVGINVLYSQGNDLDVEHCYFVNCADGIVNNQDHATIVDNCFADTGTYSDTNLNIYQGNLWPTSSVCSLGVDVIFSGGLNDMKVGFNIHFQCNIGYFNYGGFGAGGEDVPVRVMNDFWQETYYSAVDEIVNQWTDMIMFSDQGQANTVLPVGADLIHGENTDHGGWSLAGATTPAQHIYSGGIDLSQLGNGQAFAFNTPAKVFSIDLSGNVKGNSFTGNGASLTNLQGSHVIGAVSNATNAQTATTSGTTTNDVTGWPLALSVTNWFYTNTASVTVVGRSVAIGTNNFSLMHESVAFTGFYVNAAFNSLADGYTSFPLNSGTAASNPLEVLTPAIDGIYTNFSVRLNYVNQTVNAGTNLIFTLMTNGFPAFSVTISGPISGGNTPQLLANSGTQTFSLVGNTNTIFLSISNNSTTAVSLANNYFTTLCGVICK